MNNLYIMHKFVRQFAVLSPSFPSFAAVFIMLAAPFRLPKRPNLCISMKNKKIIPELFVLVTICSQLYYIIMIYIYAPEVPFTGFFAYMNSQGSKVKVFCTTAYILSITGAIAYALCYLLASDGTDYFAHGHPLPTLANILSIVSVLWFFCALLLIPKKALPETDFMLATGKPFVLAAAPIIGTVTAAAISFTYYEPADLIAILNQQRPIDTTVISAILCAVGAALSIVHYLLRMANSPKSSGAAVALGIGPIALMTGLCGLTYFEYDHHMNAPAKIALQLAWITTMLFLTSEMRVTLEKSQPRRYLASACIALFANACASIPAFTLLPSISSVTHGARIMGYALFCLFNCIYIGGRLVQFARCCNTFPASPEQDPVPEQDQGKDEQDGCQQQDSMAS